MSSALENGLKNYKENFHKNNEATYKELGTGQSPDTLMITCSDSRICPNHVTSTGPGELFVIRNAGNVMPAYTSDLADPESATLEYAVCVLKVKNIVVCGHMKCGAMGAALDPSAVESLPILHKVFDGGFKSYREWIASEHDSLTDAEKVTKLVYHNVNEQIKNLMSYPFVKERFDAKDLRIEGWVYDFESGDVDLIEGA